MIGKSSETSSSHLFNWKLVAVVCLGVAALDQITKCLVVVTLPLEHQRPVISGLLNLVHFRNTGAAWGLFQEQSFFLSLVSIVVLAILFWRFDDFTEGFPERIFALAVMSGGILGNLIDRVFRGDYIFRGAVVDFILVYYRSFHWPAFNVADIAISSGVILYMISVFLRFHTEAYQKKLQD